MKLHKIRAFVFQAFLEKTVNHGCCCPLTFLVYPDVPFLHRALQHASLVSGRTSCSSWAAMRLMRGKEREKREEKRQSHGCSHSASASSASSHDSFLIFFPPSGRPGSAGSVLWRGPQESTLGTLWEIVVNQNEGKQNRETASNVPGGTEEEGVTAYAWPCMAYDCVFSPRTCRRSRRTRNERLTCWMGKPAAFQSVQPVQSFRILSPG